MYEPPTRRILARCVEEERRHAAAGALVLARLTAADPALEARAQAWERRLLEALAAAGGVTGDVEVPLIVPPALMPDPAVVAQDLVSLPPAFDPHAVLGDLAAPLEAHRRALARGDLAAIKAELVSSAPAELAAEYERLESPFGRVDVIGCARLGHHRVVKFRLHGPHAVVILQERWVVADGGWRIAAVEITRAARRTLACAPSSSPTAARSRAACSAPAVAPASPPWRSTPKRTATPCTCARRIRPSLLGPAPARESYLDIERILDAARRTGADAVHPGYGFLSENWRFAEACGRAGLTFIGPPTEAIRAMGDKTEARRLMAAAGVPTVPGSPGPVADAAAAEAAAAAIGFPLILKAAGGGGGIGMARVERARRPGGGVRHGRRGALSRRSATRRSISSATWSGRVTSRSRCSATPTGAVVHLHERECSIQRRHQKLVEESPAPRPRPRHQARPHRGRGRRRPRHRLRQRGDDGVPGRRRRALLLPGDEHAASRSSTR